MVPADFNLRALYEALDERRRSRRLTWAAATREINRFITSDHPIATSTISGLRSKRVVEGDGVLQMLVWLALAPEDFVSGVQDRHVDRFRLPDVAAGHVLRWDARALHAALNSRRIAEGMTWPMVAAAIGGYTPGMLTRLSKGGRLGFPGVMRIVRWLDRPSADFTRLVPATLPANPPTS